MKKKKVIKDITRVKKYKGKEYVEILLARPYKVKPSGKKFINVTKFDKGILSWTSNEDLALLTDPRSIEKFMSTSYKNYKYEIDGFDVQFTTDGTID